MPKHKRKQLSEMTIGEEGFCSLESHYIGPACPLCVSGDQAGANIVTRTFLLDSEVYEECSPQATLHVRRLIMGFLVGRPDDAPPVQSLPELPLNPLSVVGTYPKQPD
jgi:hypothetical protein